MRRAAVLVVAAACALVLTGCTAPTVQKVLPTPAPSSATPAELLTPVPNGIMAAGSFRSADGSTRGDFEIENIDGQYSIWFPHFRSTFKPGPLVSLVDSKVDKSQCGVFGPAQLVVDNPRGATSSAKATRLIAPALPLDDPTYLTTLVVQTYNASETSACSNPIVAVTPIAWRVPETHPNIDVIDLGSRTSAWGTDTQRAGRPFTYLTHQGDDWVDIAKRFSITPADLTWLNPVRIGGSKPGFAYIGQVLNLDPENRGDSYSRQPLGQ